MTKKRECVTVVSKTCVDVMRYEGNWQPDLHLNAAMEISAKRRLSLSLPSPFLFILSFTLVIGCDLSEPPVKKLAITVRFSFGIVKTK